VRKNSHESAGVESAIFNGIDLVDAHVQTVPMADARGHGLAGKQSARWCRPELSTALARDCRPDQRGSSGAPQSPRGPSLYGSSVPW
jgi:hypothetical protein